MNLSNPIFHNEEKALAHIEASRWGGEPGCPHCGSVKVHKMSGRTQAGMFLCYDCRGKFTCRTGTVMERSHIPLHKWLMAMHLMAASKKGMSAKQMERMLGVTYKSAWFLCHRIREAMKSNDPDQFGEDGGIVEVDETYIGHENGRKTAPGYAHKMKVLALVDRSTGRSRAVVVDRITINELRPIMAHNISRSARLMTDEAAVYGAFGPGFASHDKVNHSKLEYGRGEIHTNTIEGYFSIFKRGMKGIYQHCAKKHLHRYLAEFDFRYTHRIKTGYDDVERAAMILKGVAGRRLMYRAAVA